MTSGKAILEVHQSSVGMVADSGIYLFVRVFDDGQVEYEESVIENNKQKIKVRQYSLSAIKLKQLKDFLNKSEVQKIAEKYNSQRSRY